MHDSSSNSLGSLLRQRRLDLGLNLVEVARLAEIEQGHLYRIEAGERSPNPKALASLATVLDLPLADLYEVAGIPLPQSLPSLRPYLRRAYGMPDHAVDEVERYLAQYIEDSNHPHSPPSQPLDGEDELPE
jgi:transcriptional regulator with XRE-family HTH domain